MALHINYDRLQDMANFHRLIRELMGVDNRLQQGKCYGLQTLKDNVSLLDEETIDQINALVVESAHEFVLKKNEKLQIKSDTYVLETNVHFPTDLNLLWDACRKGLELMKRCRDRYGLAGWRKYKDWHSSLKSALRSSGKACASKSKDKEAAIKGQLVEYLRLARELEQKLTQSYHWLYTCMVFEEKLLQVLQELCYYQQMIKKHIDLIERRLLKGESIPSTEKVYSIFEPHTEWISKGKANKKVELGHRVLVCTDQYHFILHHQVVQNQQDVALTIPLADSLLSSYNNIGSMSFDKGFYSKENKELLSMFVPLVVMPKKGKLNQEEREEESEKGFTKLRNLHSGVESNINQLEHHGLDRCPDKGLSNFKRYVSLGILSYNLHRLGKLLLKQATTTKEFSQAA